MFPILSLKSEVEMPPSSTRTLFNFSNKPNLPGHPSLGHRYLSKQNSESIMKVTAITDIPQGTCSEEFSLSDVDDLKMTPGKNILVHVTENGKLKASTSNNKWILDARFADDCQSSNVILQEGYTNNRILLQVVKPIRNGEELQLWFSESLLASLAIPFLTPVNIQGDKRYVCHRCGRQFENPNPLKIHLALDCDQFSRQHLWERLRHDPSTTDTDSGGSMNINIPIESLSLPYSSAFTTVGFKFELNPREDKRKSIIINEPQDLSTSSTRHSSTSALPSSSIATNEDFPINADQNENKRQEQSNVRGSAFKPYLNKLPFYLDSTCKKEETNTKNGRASKSNILPNIRSSVLSQPHYIFHSPSQINTPTNLHLTNTTSSTEQLNASTLFMPRVHQKQNVLSSSNFPLQLSTDDTRPEYHHAAEMETLVSNLGRSKQGHLCIYCGKIYSRKYGLKIHIRTHTGYKPLKCKYCLRPFGDPSNLNKHVRLHAEGDTPYRCDLCGKILVRRRDLERHIKSRHSPLEPEQEAQGNDNQT